MCYFCTIHDALHDRTRYIVEERNFVSSEVLIPYMLYILYFTVGITIFPNSFCILQWLTYLKILDTYPGTIHKRKTK